jgi:acetylornithine aminotransferase/acetylornithine/N-succinyldiaminopimelate aminotransferase
MPLAYDSETTQELVSLVARFVAEKLRPIEAQVSEDDAVPDAISWAKGIGGGFPLGAFWVREPFADLLGPGTHGTTYGGSPLACAAANAVFDTIEGEELLANARQRGQQLREGAKSLPLVREARGAGLLVGLEISDFAPAEGESGTPALRLTLRLIKAGLLVVPAGEQVIRLLPPLNVTAEECDEALRILLGVLAQAESGSGIPAV